MLYTHTYTYGKSCNWNTLVIFLLLYLQIAFYPNNLHFHACQPIYRLIRCFSSNNPFYHVISCTQFVCERQMELSTHSLKRLSCSGSLETGTVPSTGREGGCDLDRWRVYHTFTPVGNVDASFHIT